MEKGYIRPRFSSQITPNKDLGYKSNKQIDDCVLVGILVLAYSFLTFQDFFHLLLIKQDKKNSSSIYRTHEGKNYTKVEWQAYEEKEYEAYCKRTGRPYTPKNQETRTESQEPKSKFFAEDFEKGDENTPKKKKGFLGGLFE